MIELECPRELEAAARAALDACGIADGHLTVELVDAARIRTLNRDHRGIDEATDVREAVVHGVLHLAGHDHETDEGEMLALQDDVVARLPA